MHEQLRYGYAFVIAMSLLGLLSACRAIRPARPGPAGAGEIIAPTTTAPTPTEEPVYRYSQLLPRDGIRPIYQPEFVPADRAPLTDDELVLGIEIDDQARAYPIAILNSREMVNDELAGIPILATW